MKTFNRQKAIQIMLDKGIKTINTFIDDTGSYDTVSWNRGHRGILAKKAKAAATEGFDESMFHWDPNQKFDRNRYRERMRNARNLHPEYNRRQRKAYALMDRYHTEITPITDVLETMETPKTVNTDVNFEQFIEDIVPVNPISLKTQEVRKNNAPVATNPFPTDEKIFLTKHIEKC